jgi:hypothetical protein
MKLLINRFLPEELIRALQAAYWTIRLVILAREM